MPKKNGYDWSDISSPPVLDSHSSVKHEIMCDYLRRYIAVFTKNPNVDRVRINIIDGFAGGGRYRSPVDSEILPGSPVRLMRTMKTAEAEINACGRIKPFTLDATYYFVEIDKGAVDQLRFSLAEFGLSGEKNVYIFHDNFLDIFPKICEDIKSRRRKPRNIFILDQYGYKDVPPFVLRKLFWLFPSGTEVILTFSTDSLINYISTKPGFVRTLEKLNLGGIPNHPDLQNSIEIKQSRLLIEQLLYEEIQSQCGASFYTPFFIVSRKSNRAYWLIHLSSHPTARNEMLLTHWKNQNAFEHHGANGLNMMLGYDPTFEAIADQQTFDFYFDDDADRRVLDALIEDIPEFLAASGIFTVQELVFKTCNKSPATLDQYKHALFRLQQAKVLKVFTAKDKMRRSASSIMLDDHLYITNQLYFLL
jgi:three-Cys-motif partner protein